MIKIEEYSDYRHYLKEYYQEAKKNTPYFSYRYFCKKSGINSPGFYKSVMNGERNLTSRTIPSFIKGLGLSQNNGKFFTSLVHFTQAKTGMEKQTFLEEMRGLLPAVHEKIVPVDYYAYYSKWYYIAVRELSVLIDWKDDYTFLARHVRPRIKRNDAREAVELLLKIKFIRKNKNGRYEQCNPHISSGSEVLSDLIRNVNVQFSKLGTEALVSISPSHRDISSVAMGVGTDAYQQIKQEITLFKSRIRNIVQNQHRDNREKKDRLAYNLNVQLFPISYRADIREQEKTNKQ